MRRLVAGVLFVGLMIVTLAVPARGASDDEATRPPVEWAEPAEQDEDNTPDLTDTGLPDDRQIPLVALLLLNGYVLYQDLGGGRYDAISRWFLRRVAGLGVISAQHLLAALYNNGVDGVEPDYAEAALWYRMAANQGDAEAQYFLGRMYLDGRGVERNNIVAVYWIRKAEEQGYIGAIIALAGAYDEGRGVPRDRAEAMALYRRAADQGNVGAQFILGLLYQRGEGVPADLDQAVHWYRLAAGQGHEKAQKRLEALQQ